jgi:hypothetical protein
MTLKKHKHRKALKKTTMENQTQTESWISEIMFFGLSGICVLLTMEAKLRIEKNTV